MSSMNSVSTNLNSQATPPMRSPAESGEIKASGVVQDGDKDDSKAVNTSPTPAPTVNTSGQKIGQIINVSA